MQGLRGSAGLRGLALNRITWKWGLAMLRNALSRRGPKPKNPRFANLTAAEAAAASGKASGVTGRAAATAAGTMAGEGRRFFTWWVQAFASYRYRCGVLATGVLKGYSCIVIHALKWTGTQTNLVRTWLVILVVALEGETRIRCLGIRTGSGLV